MPGETSPEASFPSSHTMLALVVFISAAILCDTYVHDRKARRTVTAVLYGLAAVMVAGRLFSGVHWLTDIIAGILYSSFLLVLFKAVMDMPEKKRYS